MNRCFASELSNINYYCFPHVHKELGNDFQEVFRIEMASDIAEQEGIRIAGNAHSKHALISSGVALLSGIWVTQNVMGWNLINEPVKAIYLLWAIQGPAVILAYSRIRANPQNCSVLWAIGRGLLSLPVGALIHAFGAIVFGAPLGFQYAARTLHWSLFMSLLTQVVPAAAVFGASWRDWQRLFAHNQLKGGVDYAVCLPACGAVAGAWFGAWPMPLDWERPWQEWPICVTFGTIAGYLLGLMISYAMILRSSWRHEKRD